MSDQNVVHGHGVVAGEDIPRATLVSRYTGRVYTSSIAANEDWNAKRLVGTYIFKTNKGGGRWIVPVRGSKEARYFNTSSEKVFISESSNI